MDSEINRLQVSSKQEDKIINNMAKARTGIILAPTLRTSGDKKPPYRGNATTNKTKSPIRSVCPECNRYHKGTCWGKDSTGPPPLAQKDYDLRKQKKDQARNPKKKARLTINSLINAIHASASCPLANDILLDTAASCNTVNNSTKLRQTRQISGSATFNAINKDLKISHDGIMADFPDCGRAILIPDGNTSLLSFVSMLNSYQPFWDDSAKRFVIRHRSDNSNCLIFNIDPVYNVLKFNKLESTRVSTLSNSGVDVLTNSNQWNNVIA
jgi:hypothetical protein